MLRVVLCLLCCSLSFPSGTRAQETLRINTSIKPPFSTEAGDGFFDRLVVEMFGRLGYAVTFVRMPTERSLQAVNSGNSDGDLPRIAGLEKIYPHLVMVDEPLIDYAFTAFANLPECATPGWDSLRGKRIGIIIGWKIFENSAPAGAERTMFASPRALLKSLAAGRIDLALYERYAGRYLARTLGFDEIRECRPPLAVKPMYLYLNQRHRDLLERLQRVIREMKADGSYDRIRQETLD